MGRTAFWMNVSLDPFLEESGARGGGGTEGAHRVRSLLATKRLWRRRSLERLRSRTRGGGCVVTGCFCARTMGVAVTRTLGQSAPPTRVTLGRNAGVDGVSPPGCRFPSSRDLCGSKHESGTTRGSLQKPQTRRAASTRSRWQVCWAAVATSSEPAQAPPDVGAARESRQTPSLSMPPRSRIV